ncbi:MAG: MAE_28990/MAE_18760 family HEPN-like nuclease [Bacteroidia bacterium]
MPKHKTKKELFFDELESEWTWRFQELKDIQMLVKEADNSRIQSSLMRAGAVFLYAHWEGFIKRASEIYYSYVINENIPPHKLNDAFLAIWLRKELSELNETNKIILRKNAIHLIIQKIEEVAHFPNALPMKTSNMDFEELKNFCAFLGIDTIHFETRKQFINEVLVKNRHEIAHGKFLKIKDEAEFKSIYNDTIDLLRQIKTQIENAVAQDIHLRNENS